LLLGELNWIRLVEVNTGEAVEGGSHWDDLP